MSVNHPNIRINRDPKTGQLMRIPERLWPVFPDCNAGHGPDTIWFMSQKLVYRHRNESKLVPCSYCPVMWQLILHETRAVEKHRIGP